MPKNITSSKGDNGKITVNRPACKFRIGTRKSGKSANVMSTAELQKVLENTDVKRDWNNARTVLLSRGIR